LGRGEDSWVNCSTLWLLLGTEKEGRVYTEKLEALAVC
jgi:hypothetical protein